MSTRKIKTITIQRKEYVMVNEKVKFFRSEPQYKDWSIESDIIKHENDEVIVKTVIRDAKGVIRSTGLAHEVAGSSKINSTSHVENCETSAVGRALGFLGIGSDGSIASYEEVTNAIQNQEKDKAPKETPKEYILETDNWAKALKYIAVKKDTMSLAQIIKTFEDQKYGKLTTKDKTAVKKAYEGK